MLPGLVIELLAKTVIGVGLGEITNFFILNLPEVGGSSDGAGGGGRGVKSSNPHHLPITVFCEYLEN